MGEIIDLIAKVKKYYRFSKQELRAIIITILVVAFVISFKDWGSGDEVNISEGLFNLFMSIIIVFVSFMLHDFALKVASLSVGFRAEYKMWTFGLILSVILAFVTRGNFWFLIVGGVVMHHLAGHRLGFFRYGLNYFGMGLACFPGSFANIVLAIILNSINSFVNSPILHKAVLFNVAFAIFTILPIPPADGSRLFFGSRMSYALLTSFIIIASIMIIIDLPAIITIIGSLLIAALCWLLYYLLIERVIWRGPYPP